MGLVVLMKWLFVVYKNHNHPFSPQPWPVRFDIVLFSVCEVNSFDILLVPNFGIRLEGRTRHNNPPKRANSLEMRNFKGQVFDCLFYHKASFLLRF